MRRQVILSLALAGLLAGSAAPSEAQQSSGSLDIQKPAAALADPRPLTVRLARFLTIPFRVDGATDEAGHWVTFNQPLTVSEQPGFNCSGFTVAAARELLGRDFNLTEASRDRLGDSGPGAPLGQDWDFGLDLILNLAEDYPHRFLPEPPNQPGQPPLIPLRPRRALGWGVNLHGPEFEEQLARIQPGRFCFFTFSRPDGHFPAGVSYYHVGVIVSDPPDLWLYHTTVGARTHRVNLADPEQLARLRRHFKPVENGERRVFMVEVTPPGAPGIVPAEYSPPKRP